MFRGGEGQANAISVWNVQLNRYKALLLTIRY
jgi:hypothetical protein